MVVLAVRTGFLRSAVAILATVSLLGASPAPAFVPSGDDLLAMPLPSEEPHAARSVVRCELVQQRFCDRIVERMLAIPFAWHRAGYEVVILDTVPREVLDASLSDSPNGATLKHERELHVYYPQLRDVSEETIIGIVALTKDLARVMAHEVGHSFHQTCDERTFLRTWRDARGMEGSTPRRGHGHDGWSYSSIAEDVAESAVVYLLDGQYDSRTSVDAYELTAEHLFEVSELLRTCA